MKFKNILNESNKTLNASIKRKLNSDLGKLTFNTYFDSIPLTEIKNILKKYHVILLQEDNTEWSGFFTGYDGKANIDIGNSESTMGGKFYVPYNNVNLVLTWHKMPSGKYEIVTYIG